MTDERIALGQRLKEAREYQELSQQEVADALRLPRSAISLIEAGQRKVETLELKAMAQIYGRPIGHFTGEVQPAAVPESVTMLARKAEKLSEADRAELLRFSDFLMQRSKANGGPGE
ncbi:helix-turn-helix transcriptional regulator [Ramlibacter sp.]|uniref:helix-turn-helix domain-containing protein n=1 Tax=Ramlibacter sp. TaxID=1917967 RepID=UPI002BD0245B|nr:helix-turn-helix transcriptional regulator [Ramlibacter sp.]HWI81574.1 helix-turn-helix transcriptional regulator [Ramlibacter sp.]